MAGEDDGAGSTEQPAASKNFNTFLTLTVTLTVLMFVIAVGIVMLADANDKRADELFSVCTHVGAGGAGAIFGLLRGKGDETT